VPAPLKVQCFNTIVGIAYLSGDGLGIETQPFSLLGHVEVELHFAGSASRIIILIFNGDDALLTDAILACNASSSRSSEIC
jgi:hypothetical protein